MNTMKPNAPQAPAVPAGFNPTHIVMLLTNHLPKGPVEEAAFWERMQAVPAEPWARLSGMKGGDAA